jgi:hypothetical protein
MIDIIKSINADQEINIKEIYELFKTESPDLNSKFLTQILKYKDINEFFTYYSKLDFKNVSSIFNDLESLTLIISNKKDEENIFDNQTDKYLCDISKIIFSLLLVEKTNKLLNNFISTSKSTINEFFSKNEKNSISTNINNCLNSLINTSPDFIQRSLSRRGTREKTNTSNNNKSKRNSLLSDMTSNDTEIILLDNNTPKFKEKELSNKDSSKDKKDESSLKESEKSMDSILSLKNMKFLSETGDMTIRGIRKKNKTIKIGFEKQEAELFLKQKSNSNKINEKNSSNLDELNSNTEYNSNSLDKSKILADLLNAINCLFENNKINLEQKLSLKQLLISDSESVINRLFKFNETNFPFNTNLKNIFKKFLIMELDNI